jgi:hypothetical protein
LTVVVVNVESVIASENVADTEALGATPLAPLAGEVEVTVGGVVSGAAAVVKRQVKLAPSALPAESVTLDATTAVYCVLGARAAEGVNLAVLPLMLTVPASAPPPVVGDTLNVAVVSDELVIASENVADTVELVATPFAAFEGDTDDTVGGVVSGAAPVVNVQE